jgi:hypothetical protein
MASIITDLRKPSSRSSKYVYVSVLVRVLVAVALLALILGFAALLIYAGVLAGPDLL